MRFLVLFLVACASLPHVEPQSRSHADQLATVVTVESYCGGIHHKGTGVVISERHVLTAYHVTKCHVIPKVNVTLRGNVTHMMYVTKENEKQDIARLELAHAGRFRLNVAPPKLAPYYARPNDSVCAFTRRGTHCAVRLGPNTFAGQLIPGDSGSPVYDDGYLAGLVTRISKEKNMTIMTIVTSNWLEGT